MDRKALLPLAAIVGLSLLFYRTVRAAGRATVMFITHAEGDFQFLPQVVPYLETDLFNVWPYNYCFQFNPPWGNYFDLATSDDLMRETLREIQNYGIKNLFYIDPTEIDKSLSSLFPDSILQESEDWWCLMTLDPSKSWFKYLKEGMLNLKARFPETLSGFAIDRLDRAYSIQEANWARQLLEEVRSSSDTPTEYCMNTLQLWQTDLSSLSSFIGSDGIDVNNLPSVNRNYRQLASRTTTKKYYLVGRTYWMPGGVEGAISDLRKILAVHPFIFIEDNMAEIFIPALFS